VPVQQAPGLRVGMVDPGSILPYYTHALSTALGQLGCDVTLATSHFKFEDPPTPGNYARREVFYPVSARLFRRSRAQLPLKALEHPLGAVQVRRLAADTVHVQWAAVPEIDRWLLPLGPSSVITAHDVLPRRTAHRVPLWRDLYQRFGGVVVHSSHGRDRLVAEVGLDPAQIQVIPHPAFFRQPRYEDDGATLLTFGVIRPYKQVEHSVAAAEDVGARLMVLGDPTYELGPLLAAPHVSWRLGFARETELDEALARATVAVFPYRQELDQSGALMRCLGAGVPAVVYDVGGMAEPVRAYGAGAVVRPDDQVGLRDAVRRLLSDPLALRRARQGARRCAVERTWHACAAAHLDLYRRLQHC
jgi:glycosyltransferase involved in cell wall biosynthesis